MNIAVMFGSRSVEHDVSITSAYGVIKGLEKIGKYTVYPIYVTRSGKWLYDSAFGDINSFKDFDEKNYENKELRVVLGSSKKLILEQSSGGLFSKTQKLEIDFVFPIFHGMNGEDGAIQGMLDMLQVPYMGPGISGSAIGMNKIIMKNVFKALDLPITKYMVFKRGETTEKMQKFLEETTQKSQEFSKSLSESPTLQEVSSSDNDALPFPLIIKPANLGSSIGISRVVTKSGLRDAIEIAAHYDQYIIIEECVQNLCELNCSVSEKDGEPITSHVEQPVSQSEFLSFEEKYISADGGTMQGLKNKVKIPAEIPDGLAAQIKEYSKIIYKELFCNGGAPRIDYLYDKVAKKLYVNEINTIPGALQMHLWDRSDMKVSDFLENLIQVGLQKAEERKINIDFKSNIIGHTINFVK